MAQEVSKSWFAVFNNPADHGYEGTPQEVCERLRDEWIVDSTTRSGAWVYCVSAAGLHHIHMVLEDLTAMRFSVIKKSYAVGMHFEPTRGTKQQAEDYINKRHPFDEKGEVVVYKCQQGVIRAAPGQRRDIEQIENLIAEGHNPEEIMEMSFSFRKYERMIKSAYFRKRAKETPVVRDVKVHYVTGESGSGKSYTYAMKCDEAGEGNIAFITDYDNGGFDHYAGEPILFLDEYKGQFKFSTFLTVLDHYKSQVHARYSNAVALWTEVYITSVFPPDQLYKKMVEEDDRGIDKQQQLLRRITDITYCFRDLFGVYHRFTLPMEQYKNIEQLRSAAIKSELGEQISFSDALYSRV